ncbi:hypothetical protein LTR94_034409, partial [Friedmanniomyces endolithicus]
RGEVGRQGADRCGVGEEEEAVATIAPVGFDRLTTKAGGKIRQRFGRHGPGRQREGIAIAVAGYGQDAGLAGAEADRIAVDQDMTAGQRGMAA